MKILKFFTDGGCRKNPGPAASAVYFPETGEGLGGFIGESRTNNEAEAEALVMALDYARARHINQIEAFSDSQLLVHLVKGWWRASAPTMEVMLDKIQDRLPYFVDWDISWVPRAQNADADKICNRVLDAAERGEYITCPTLFRKIPSSASSDLHTG